MAETYSELHAKYSGEIAKIMQSPGSGLPEAMVAASVARKCYAEAIQHILEIFAGARQDSPELGDQFEQFASALALGSVVAHSRLETKFSDLMGEVSGSFASWMVIRAAQLRDEFAAANAVDPDDEAKKWAGQELPMPEAFRHLRLAAGQTATFHVPEGRAADCGRFLREHLRALGLRVVVFSCGDAVERGGAVTVLPKSVWEKAGDRGGFSALVTLAAELHQGEVDVFLFENPQIALTPSYSFQPAARVAAALNQDVRKFTKKLGRWALYAVDCGYGDDREDEDFAELRAFSTYEKIFLEDNQLRSASGWPVTFPELQASTDNGEESS